jgi:type IV pilus assembly protein PilA
MRKIFNNRGFTLIELMIVVVIIGLLAAIAIPNYLQFQAMAKQAEAKSNLGGIFTNEQAYYGENSKYTPVLTETGFSILTVAKYYDFTVVAPTSVAGTPPVCTFPPNAWYGRSGNPGDGPPAGSEVAFNGIPGASDTAFTAVAEGDIDGDPAFDAWEITSHGKLKPVYDDSKL